MKINTPVLTDKAGATWTLFSGRTISSKVSQVNDVLFMLTDDHTLVKTTDYGETVQTVYTSSNDIIDQVLAVNENHVLAVLQNRDNMQPGLCSFKYDSSISKWLTTTIRITNEAMTACINKRDNSLYIFDMGYEDPKIWKVSYDTSTDSYDTSTVAELAIAANHEYGLQVVGYPTIITRNNEDILIWQVYNDPQIIIMTLTLDSNSVPSALINFTNYSISLSCLPVYVPDSDILVLATYNEGLFYITWGNNTRNTLLSATEQDNAITYSSICYTKDGRLIVTKEPYDVTLGISRVVYTDNFTTWHNCKDANDNDITTISMVPVLECDSGKLIAAGGYGQSDPVYGTISSYSSLPVTGDQAKEYVRQFKAYVQSLKQT